MFRALKLVCEQIVVRGNLCLVDTSGNIYRFGDGTGIPVVVRFSRDSFEPFFHLDPGLAVAEAYMDGRLILDRGRIYDFLAIVLSNAENSDWPRTAQIAEMIRRIWKRVQQFNPRGRSRRNVAHHYDIDRAIYELFLDDDLQYSCAYFENTNMSLEDAQVAKKRHIASKLLLRRGQTVLDIGSGWGGLGLYLAQRADVHVKGITLSREQLDVARTRAARLGLSAKARFAFEDYRQLEGTFDRIVSVGMFEHVGVSHYPSFFRALRDHLEDDGVALLHAIGRFDGPAATNPFIAKYIFPGGYIPALSEVVPIIERSDLLITDVEILRLHYAETLRHWRQRFIANWDTVASIKGERFCRMWEFYLAGAEGAFRFENLMVFQIQMAKSRDSVPLTRDYVYAEEERLRSRDHAIEEAPRLAGE